MGSGGEGTVLVVEDDADNRELTAEVLQAAGYRVLTAASGPEAVHALAEGPVDALVADVGLPGVSGLEVARAARRLAPAAAVLLLTGDVRREEVAASRGREADEVLEKPLDPEVLVRTVGRLVRARRGTGPGPAA